MKNLKKMQIGKRRDVVILVSALGENYVIKYNYFTSHVLKMLASKVIPRK